MIKSGGSNLVQVVYITLATAISELHRCVTEYGLVKDKEKKKIIKTKVSPHRRVAILGYLRNAQSPKIVFFNVKTGKQMNNSKP